MLANIIIIAILVSLVTLAIRKIVRDKKTGHTPPFPRFC